MRILLTAIKCGTLGALAMVPFGLAFRAAGMRVGYYGPKFAALFVDNPGTPYLFAQHIVLGWISAVPLVLVVAFLPLKASPVLLGLAYGAAYYVLVNSLALPLYFGDPTPWTLGISSIIPSVVIHLVFGATVGFVLQKRKEHLWQH